MSNTTVRLAAAYSVIQAGVSHRLETAMRGDRGEIGSWMILAAGLAAAAVAALALLTPWFGEKATDITNN